MTITFLHVVHPRSLYAICCSFFIHFDPCYKCRQCIADNTFNTFQTEKISSTSPDKWNWTDAQNLSTQILVAIHAGWPLSTQCEIPRHFPDCSRHSCPCWVLLISCRY